MPDIDIVVPWVDSSDPEWAAEFARYSNTSPMVSSSGKEAKTDVRAERYRDYGLMRFWFRGVERFAPWVRKVHFVTNGQKPAWLNVNAGKLRWVKHEDYIPKECLPVFSARPIEILLHKIPGLSDRFIYFNDDFFLVRPTKAKDFFRRGLPVDMCVYRPLFPLDNVMSRTRYNNVMHINSCFEKRRQQKRNAAKIFNVKYGLKNLENASFFPARRYSAFLDPHFAQPYTKTLFEEVWAHCGDSLRKTALHRFRAADDVNVWLFRYWNLVRGTFAPENVMRKNKYFDLSDDPTELNAICSAIENQKYRLVVLNDAEVRDPQAITARLTESFSKILPEKSSFEL